MHDESLKLTIRAGICHLLYIQESATPALETVILVIQNH
jgi:hypothetical protein